MIALNKDPGVPHNHAAVWRRVTLRLLPGGAAAVGGIILSLSYGPFQQGAIDRKVLVLLGITLFVVFAIVVINGLTKTLRHVLADSRLSIGHAAIVQFVVRVVGYAVILLEMLSLLGVPVGSLIIGGAALGIILGVAAQQALSNIFASFVLIVVRPFAVGDRVTVNAGGFGRKYSGNIKEIGLTHTRLLEKNGTIVLLPNASLLQWAAISPQRRDADNA